VPHKIITIYCFFDELLKAHRHKDHCQATVTTAEIMTVALVAAEFFTGNQQAALDFLVSHRYIKPLSKSRFNRRLHAIDPILWQAALFVLAQVHQATNPDKIHIVDTFPVPVCRNIRIKRCKIYQNEAFRGYCASKKEYYFGLKVCVVITASGQPVEVLLAPGSTADIETLRRLGLDLPEASTLFGDSGFLDKPFETALQEEADIALVVPRRKNMKEQLPGWLQYICQAYRKRVETTFSQMAERFARSIHAVTPRGFELKVFLTVLAVSILP
jgi:hypothetical protein